MAQQKEEEEKSQEKHITFKIQKLLVNFLTAQHECSSNICFAYLLFAFSRDKFLHEILLLLLWLMSSENIKEFDVLPKFIVFLANFCESRYLKIKTNPKNTEKEDNKDKLKDKIYSSWIKLR